MSPQKLSRAMSRADAFSRWQSSNPGTVLNAPHAQAHGLPHTVIAPEGRKLRVERSEEPPEVTQSAGEPGCGSGWEGLC